MQLAFDMSFESNVGLAIPRVTMSLQSRREETKDTLGTFDAVLDRL